MKLTILIVSLLVALSFMATTIKVQLHMLQQSSYRADRYLKWLKGRFSILHLLLLLLWIAVMAVRYTPIIAILPIVMAATILLLRKKSKKPIAFTPRVKRLYGVSTALVILISTAVAIFIDIDMALRVAFSLSSLAPIVVLIANMILAPVEKSINNYYINDARRIVASMPNLKIIGITGSYGKTSTKHFLHRILSEKYSTLMTPGSYNTTLGVVRTIREHLKPYHEIFIVEMGAKQLGDIKEICDLVHPQMAILTSIGEQHLESFKSIDNVRRTKFELIDSLPSSGLAVLNIDFSQVVKQRVTNVTNIVRYGSTNGADLILRDIRYSNGGTKFEIYNKREDRAINFTTSILGIYNISNIVASYAIASHLGVDEAKIKSAVERLDAVEHRLQIRHSSAGVTIIDDAFNSNPKGANMALEVLREFAPQTRVLITPGMIELGAKQYEYNALFGEKAALCADYVIVVGQYNSKAIGDGLQRGGFDKDRVYYAATLNIAAAHLTERFKDGGYVVLYENDLPDTFK